VHTFHLFLIVICVYCFCIYSVSPSEVEVSSLLWDQCWRVEEGQWIDLFSKWRLFSVICRGQENWCFRLSYFRLITQKLRPIFQSACVGQWVPQKALLSCCSSLYVCGSLRQSLEWLRQFANSFQTSRLISSLAVPWIQRAGLKVSLLLFFTFLWPKVFGSSWGSQEYSHWRAVVYFWSFPKLFVCVISTLTQSWASDLPTFQAMD